VIPLVPVQRPNGKWYRPRKIVAAVWDNEIWGHYGGGYGVYVLGTHDIEASRQFATEMIAYWHDGGMVASKPCLCWVRDGFNGQDRAWVTDDVRGRAAVCWTAVYPEDLRTTDKET
jgi:hypothetical protein